MLLNFRVENFLSFDQETEFTMISDSTKTESKKEGFVIELEKTRQNNSIKVEMQILRGAAFYGGNAS